MIGVIVDGPGDFASLRARFEGIVKVRKADGPRGHTVSIELLLSSARRQVRQLAAEGCKHVILMFDFEMRNEDYHEFLRLAREELKRQRFATKVSVQIPNRMIENWYLADLEELSRSRAYVRDNLKQRNFEGLHGKTELKRYLKPNIKYDEIRHGAQLFSTIRLPIACKNSPSLRAFICSVPKLAEEIEECN